MITQVEHSSAGAGATEFALALAIAGALNPPTAPSRAPELATAPPSAGRRTSAGRSRRRTVRG
ncbi:hypothetical protein [Streptomyces chartreusis]|uniref:hypothetical protein n=1 Tax=Streptomyces chartreusis TaxID=1969 RepID=UPI00123D8047|nr:hypothetical protein [Streptomyces chartreusis]QEV69229.1 hypothetical protein CP983_22945 [Streptomyces chartreusis]GGX19548.1 hypothetical protein GCM10010321_37760 [Streptomyces chartreusis]